MDKSGNKSALPIKQIRTTNIEPENFGKSLLETVLERKSNENVRNSHYQEPLAPIQILQHM